mgnify:CR=1 FL=1
MAIGGKNLKSVQLRVFVVDDREMQFNLDRFQRLFLNNARIKGIPIGNYENELAKVLYVERSTIHNWRMNMNGPSDLEKIRMLEEYWNLGVNGLLMEVKGMQIEKKTMKDRELDALKRLPHDTASYVSIIRVGFAGDFAPD